MQIGELFAERYRILSKIGSGGMADVFLAEDTTLNRQIAIKALYKQYAAQDNFVNRFRHEAQAAAGLNHPNIVSIYDWGQRGEDYYIAMEYVHGRSLKRLIRDHAPFTISDGMKILMQVCSALQHAHKADIVHRDIKPHNILVTDEGDVKVTDFGIARIVTAEAQMTQTGMVLGTAHYISPEQARGFQARQVSDIYSLGVVMYEMFTGKLPFDGENPVAVALKHTQDVPPAPHIVNPNIPDPLERIILKAMARSPEKRYQSVADLREDLRRFIKGMEVSAEDAFDEDEPTILMMPVERPADRRPKNDGEGSVNWTAWISLIVFLLIAAAGVSYLTYTKLVPKTVKVPSLVGLTEERALERLKTRGLRLNITSRSEHDIVPTGRVISQNPEAGSSLKEDSEVDVVISTGKPQINVPDVVGMTEVEAARALLEIGLDIGEVERKHSTEEEGSIIEQDPDPGTEVAKKTKVNIIVSSGVATTPIPDVIGDSEQEAISALATKNLKMIKQTEYSETVGTGEVIRTIPSPGTLVEEGSSVTVVMSLGIQLFQVPDVVGLTSEEAKTKIEAAGFVLESVPFETDDEASWGKITEQSPVGGSMIEKGRTVTVQVGQAPIAD